MSIESLTFAFFFSVYMSTSTSTWKNVIYVFGNKLLCESLPTNVI